MERYILRKPSCPSKKEILGRERGGCREAVSSSFTLSKRTSFLEADTCSFLRRCSSAVSSSAENCLIPFLSVVLTSPLLLSAPSVVYTLLRARFAFLASIVALTGDCDSSALYTNASWSLSPSLTKPSWSVISFMLSELYDSLDKTVNGLILQEDRTQGECYGSISYDVYRVRQDTALDWI